MKANILYRSASDRYFNVAVFSCAALAALVSAFIFLFLLLESWNVLRQVGIGSFINDPGWFPLEGQFGLRAMIAGSTIISLGALLMSLPLGLMLALFHHFYAPSWARVVSRRVLEVLVSIPSVVFGFWGLTVLVPLINDFHPPGQSSLAGAIVVAIMILPTVTMVLDAALTDLPNHVRLAAFALGFSQWTTIFKVILPQLRPGIIASATLAFGRAFGETMAVLMVAGNLPQVPSSIFDPVRTLTANIALEMAYAVNHHRAGLFVSGFIFLIVTSILAVIAHRMAPAESRL